MSQPNARSERRASEAQWDRKRPKAARSEPKASEDHKDGRPKAARSEPKASEAQ